MPAGGTKVTVDNPSGFAVDDLIQIGEEILKIVGLSLIHISEPTRPC